MQTDLNDIIRDYLNNQLTPEKKQAFEQRLSADPVFAAQATELATLQTAILKAGNQELEAQLTSYAKELLQIDATESPSPAAANNIRKMTVYSRIVYAAAILIGLMVVALPFWLMNRSGTSFTSTEEIYAANFTTPPVSEVRGNEAQAAWRLSYDRGDYQTTVTQLDALLADASFANRSEAFLYLGIAQLALGNANAALPALSQVREESFDWEPAQWYSALALLKLKRIDDAKLILLRISRQTAHPQQEQAKEILEKL